MKAFDGLRIKAGEHYLKKAVKQSLTKRSVKFTTFDEAINVGVLARIEDLKKLNKLKSYIRYLKENHGVRKVVLLGYHDMKKLSDGLQQPLDVHILCRKDINWYGKPSGVDFKNFVDQEFDMLIDLTNSSCVPLNFAIAESKSRFKIGQYSIDKDHLYDFMLMVQSDRMEDLIKEVDNYLASKKSASVYKNQNLV
ncbi:MAG: DUF6913 domain-containing protein [Flavobacteriales bacterium]